LILGIYATLVLLVIGVADAERVRSMAGLLAEQLLRNGPASAGSLRVGPGCRLFI
jgi:hypothetical protein